MRCLSRPAGDALRIWAEEIVDFTTVVRQLFFFTPKMRAALAGSAREVLAGGCSFTPVKPRLQGLDAVHKRYERRHQRWCEGSYVPRR
jgi:hypothetical protein